MLFTHLETVSTSSKKISGPYDIPLYVETYGNPDAEQTILLLHGGFQSLRCFRKQFASLSRHAYVIALDLPYHGESQPVPSTVAPSPVLWAESVRAVLTHLERVEKPLVTVAWSFGGLVTRHYLLTYGLDHIQGLVLVGSLFGGMGAYQQFQEPSTTQIVLTKISEQVSFPERFRAFEQFVAMLTKHPLPSDESYAQYGYNVKAFLQSLPGASQWLAELPCDQQQFFEQVQVPVLLIQGLDDALVPLAYTRHLALSLPHAQLLEYESCGHPPFVEQPERFNRDVLRFCTSLAEKE